MDQAWTDHGTDSLAVAARISDFVAGGLSGQDQIPAVVSLITHVYGEHLGRWDEGIALLEKLQLHADSAENRNTIYRNVSALRLAGGLSDNVDDLLNSDQIGVLCVASATLVGQKEIERASGYFNDALSLAAEGLADGDPALRSLAITGNNLAAELERRKNRTPQQTGWMVRAARAALEYWLRAGQWPQHQRAHFRLSKSLLESGDHVEALEEAMSCLAICKSHNAAPNEMFWAYEAVASVIRVTKPSAFVDYLKNMREAFEGLAESDKARCEPRLREMESSIA